jgi:hypothetical protein
MRIGPAGEEALTDAPVPAWYKHGMTLTSSQVNRVRSMATGDWRSNPSKPYEKVVDDAARSVMDVRPRKPVEKATSDDQVGWFEVGAVVMTTRADLVRDGRLRGLVAELKALVRYEGPRTRIVKARPGR